MLTNLCLFLCTKGQEFSFTKPALDEPGLTGTMLDLTQDRHGFLWIATTDGLKKYDGVNVTTYRRIPEDSTSLTHNFITSLFEDSRGNLWIGTNSGLNLYDPIDDNFKRYYFDTEETFHENGAVLSIHEDGHGDIWLSTYYGRLKIEDFEERKVEHYLPVNDENNTSYSPLTWSVYGDSRGRLWTGNQGWVSIMDSSSQAFRKLYPNGINVINNLSTQYWSFAESSDGTIWIGSDDGLFLARTESDSIIFEKLTFSEGKGMDLNQAFINDIYIDDRECIFISTYHSGLFRIDPIKMGTNPRVTQYKSDSQDETALRFNRVFSTIKDQSGIYWIATQTGLNKVLANESKFKRITTDPQSSTSLSNNIIKAFEMDQQGNLWVGTFNGLNHLTAENLATENYSFSHFYHSENDPTSIIHNNIFDLLIDDQNRLFVCTRNGISYADLNNTGVKPAFRHITRLDGLPHTWVHGITQISPGDYWVATYGGFARVTFNEEDQVQILVFESSNDGSNGIVNSMSFVTTAENDESYWIGTFNGLSELITSGPGIRFNNFVHDRLSPNGLSDNSVIDIHRDDKGRMWLGTRSGINLIQRNPSTEQISFQSFGTNDGFVNDVIQSIEEDDQGLLWLGTNQGIVHFNPDEALAGNNGVIRNYGLDDGLGGPGQIFRSSFKSYDGRMFFGSPDGVNYFHPDSIFQRSYEPDVMITDISILERSIQDMDQESYIEGSVHSTPTLSLSHRDKMIRISYASSDLNQPDKNQYRYRLLGFEDQWIESRNESFAQFSSIPPGDYTLEIQVSNSDRVWSNKIRQLGITVHPPWWKTAWAYALFIGLFGILIYVSVQNQIRKKIKKVEEEAKMIMLQKEAREAMRKKNAADYHDELGHRLTKISLLLSMAENDEGQAKTNGISILSKLKENVQALSEGVKDLIWSIDPDKDSLFETFFRLQEFGDQLFTFSDIDFKTEKIAQHMSDYAIDAGVRKHILLLFKEAMNNCLKYSQASSALLTIAPSDNGYLLSFQDDGVGFDMLHSRPGYGLQSMRERANKINATLHIKGIQDKGTLIELLLSCDPQTARQNNAPHERIPSLGDGRKHR